MKLYDAASVCRSKNAGPFQVTVDLMFRDMETYLRVLESPEFTVENIGRQAVDLLLKRAENSNLDAEQIMVKPELVIRSSVKIR